MERRPRTPRIVWVVPALALAVGAAACTGDDAGGVMRAGSAEGLVWRLGPPASAASEDTAAATARPDEIYYDLTAYEWYRRGEPLIAGDLAFQPDGVPLPVSFDSLRRAGNYQGVDYYVRRDLSGSHDTLFVPVFDDYWQPFLPVGSAPAANPAARPQPASSGP